MTNEQLDAASEASYQKWKIDIANKKKPIEPIFPRTEEDVAKAIAQVKLMAVYPPPLPEDYDRSIRKSAEAKEQRLQSISSSGKSSEKSVAQLGEQKNQSCPPLKVYSDAEVRSRRAAAEQRYDPETDPELVELYGEAAAAQGMSIRRYLNHINEFADIAYKYRHGHPLVKPELVKELPTKMRRLHIWYMRQSAANENWINIAHRNEHYGHGDDVVMIEFDELFQLYQQDALDKSIMSAYCL